MRRVNISYPILRQTLLKTFQPIPLTNIRSRPAKHRAPLITTISGYWITVNQLVRSIYIYARYLSRSIARLIDIGFVNLEEVRFHSRTSRTSRNFASSATKRSTREREREIATFHHIASLSPLLQGNCEKLAGWLAGGWMVEQPRNRCKGNNIITRVAQGMHSCWELAALLLLSLENISLLLLLNE